MDIERELLEEAARSFFIHGGGGHEGGEDGARASTFTFAGMVDMAAAFAEYVLESLEVKLDDNFWDNV